LPIAPTPLTKETTSNLTTFLNPYSYLIARKNIATFSSFDNIYFDGIVLSKLMNAIGARQSRVSFDMTSLAPKVFQHASNEKQTVYFIGGEQGISEQAAKILRTEYPKLNIIGCRCGFFKDEKEKNLVIEEIVSTRPDIVICGMGTPHQENFILLLKESGWIGSGFTCGGFFHQTAKTGIKYYPFWFDKLNLRWLYRIIDEPKLLKRYSLHYPIFLIVFMLDVTFYKKHRHFIKKNPLNNLL